MDWLPGQTCDPLDMAFHGIADGLSRLRVPYPNVSVVSTRGEFPLSCLPLDAKDPPFVPREHMRRGFGVKVPHSGVRIAGSRGQHVPGRGKRRTEDGGAVACKTR